MVIAISCIVGWTPRSVFYLGDIFDEQKADVSTLPNRRSKKPALSPSRTRQDESQHSVMFLLAFFMAFRRISLLGYLPLPTVMLLPCRPARVRVNKPTLSVVTTTLVPGQSSLVQLLYVRCCLGPTSDADCCVYMINVWSDSADSRVNRTLNIN